MAYARKEIENADVLSAVCKKKFVRYDEGATLFSLGQHTFERIAKEAGAIYRIGRICIVNVEIVEEYLENFRMEPELF